MQNQENKKISNGLKNLSLKQQSILYSISAFAYIVLVALLMSNGNKLFGENDKSVLTPIGVLLLFVLSAAVMASLIFGKPILMYLEDNKKDAVKLAIYNIVHLFIITVIYFIFLFLIK